MAARLHSLLKKLIPHAQGNGQERTMRGADHQQAGAFSYVSLDLQGLWVAQRFSAAIQAN